MNKHALFTLLFMSILLSACGQSGRLYLPPDETPKVVAETSDTNANTQPP